MADGKIEIELDVKDSKAQSQGKKAGDQIAKGVEQGIKNVGKSADTAAKQTEKSFQSAAKSAKSSFSDVGSAAKSGFGDVGDAAKNAADDASSAFESVPADAKGAFADVGSEAKSGFDGVADAAGDASSDAASKFESIPADAAGAFDDVGSAARSGFSGVTDAAEDAGDSVHESLGVKTVAAGNLLADALSAAASKIVELGQNAIESGMSFDKSMSQVAATMGVTTDEIGQLRDYAKQMGETTAFSASEAADALNYMALAGYDAETSMRVLPTVLNLAAAGNMDLARASDMVTDAQSALGLSVEEAEEMVDKMAKTSSKSNTSVEQLGDAFLTVGGLAKNLAGGTTELSQVLGVLADNGTKGAEGGTALRNVILSLSAPTDKAAESIKELGVEIFDAQGNMRPLPEIFQDFNTALDPLTQQEKTNVLNNIFNKVDLTKVQNLLGTSADRFDELALSIDNAQGSAQKMADTQLENLAGDVTLLESATEGFYIAVSDALTPALRGLTQFGTNTLLPFLTDAVKNFDKIAPYVITAAAAIALMVTRGKTVSILNAIYSGVAKSVGMTTAEFKALSVAEKASAVSTKGLSTAMKALKAAAPIAAITALIEICTYLYETWKKDREHAEKLSKATSGLESALGSTANAAKGESSAFAELGSSIEKIDIDEFLDKHVQLADSIRETSQQAITSKAMLSDYGGAIEELAGRSDLSEEELAKLKLAVDRVNEACGTSYEVVGGNGEAYQIMADGAIQAKDSVLQVIEAQKLQIQAEADLQNYQALYSQWQEDNAKLAEAKNAVTEASKKLAQAERDAQTAQDPIARAQASADMAKYGDELKNAESALRDVEDATNATSSAMNRANERTILNEMAMSEDASAIIKAAQANEGFKSGVQATATELVGFTKSLEEMGYTADEIAALSQDDAMKLADAWKSGFDITKNSASETATDVIARLEGMGSEAYETTYGSGQQAGQGFTAGLSSEAQSAIDAAISTVGMTRDEFDKLAAEAGIEGDDAGVAFANSLAATRGQAESAGRTDAASAAKGLNTVDGKPYGTADGTQYAQGVASAEGQSRSAGETDANAAKGGFQSQNQNAHSWGFDLGSLFANGIRAAQDLVSGAANFLGGIVQSILGHSVPKEGILRNGGQGEKPWGEHLVQNIAEGMTSRKAQRAIRESTKAVAVDINDSLMRELSGINPMVQLEESLAKGSAAFSMSAMMVGAAPSYTNNNQTVNFNGDIQSPDIIARNMRLQQHYGLAGKY